MFDNKNIISNDLNYLSDECSAIIIECQNAISRKHNLMVLYQITSMVLCFIGMATMTIPLVASLCFLFILWLMLAINYASKSESDYRVSLIRFIYIRTQAEDYIGKSNLKFSDVQKLHNDYSRTEAYHYSFVK